MRQPTLSSLSSDQSPFQLLFTLTFAAYPLVVLTTFMGHRVVPIVLLLLAFAAMALKHRDWTPGLTTWAWALALLTGPFYIGYLFGEINAPTMERVSYGWLFLIVGAAAVSARPNHSVLVGTLIIGAYATLLAQLITGGERPSLVFNAIPYAEVAAGFFCLLAVGVDRMKRSWMTVALIIGMIGWLAVIALTQTRGAVLAIVPGIAYMLGCLANRFGKRISLVALVGIVLVGWLGDSLSGNLVSDRFRLALDDVRQYQEAPQKFSSTAVRLELWRSAILVAEEHPMGLGEEQSKKTALEWSREGKLQSYVQPQLKVAHFHSDYFQQLAVAGYVGLVGLLLFYALLMGYFFKHRHQLTGSMGLVFTASYMVSGLTDVPLYNKLTLFTFFVVITFCIINIRPHKESELAL